MNVNLYKIFKEKFLPQLYSHNITQWKHRPFTIAWSKYKRQKRYFYFEQKGNENLARKKVRKKEEKRD